MRKPPVETAGIAVIMMEIATKVEWRSFQNIQRKVTPFFKAPSDRAGRCVDTSRELRNQCNQCNQLASNARIEKKGIHVNYWTWLVGACNLVERLALKQGKSWQTVLNVAEKGPIFRGGFPLQFSNEMSFSIVASSIQNDWTRIIFHELSHRLRGDVVSLANYMSRHFCKDFQPLTPSQE